MRTGVTFYFQGYPDWERYLKKERGETDQPIDPQADSTRWAEEIDSALKIEDQGFDSIWTVEHHISPYTMIPNPIEFLAFIAGATRRVDVGTMVVVLPWHHPLRVAEDITILQHVLRGRTPYIGFGRGLARREYRQLGFDMNESRERFAESVEIIKLALTQETFSFKGEKFQFEDVTMRPRPRDPQAILDNLHFSWGSASSAPLGGLLGLKPMVIPQKAWSEYHADLEAFAKTRAEIGLPPARPRIHMNMFCAETEAQAEEMAGRFLPQYAESSANNYETAGDHFQGIKGYEEYAKRAADMKALVASGVDTRQLRVDNTLANHCWGTPDQCVAKLQQIAGAFHPEEFMLVTRYGAMPKEVSDRSVDLFAREVLPAVHEIPTLEPIEYGAAV